MTQYEVVQRVTVDVSKGLPAPTVYCKQADNMVRVLEVTLQDNGNNYSVQQGFTARLRGTKADGTRIYLDARKIHENIAEFVLTDKALSYPGKAACEVALSSANGDEVKTCNLVLDIRKSALDDKAVESTDEFQSLNKAVAEAKAAQAAAETKAKASEQSAENALKSEKAAKESETLSQNSRVAAEQSATKANSSAVGAENYAKTAREMAAQAETAASAAKTSAKAAKDAADKLNDVQQPMSPADVEEVLRLV